MLCILTSKTGLPMQRLKLSLSVFSHIFVKKRKNRQKPLLKAFKKRNNYAQKRLNKKFIHSFIHCSNYTLCVKSTYYLITHFTSQLLPSGYLPYNFC